jgi:GT2 family glycosyltransferase
MQHPLVSIITINYGHADVTCQLLDSLRHITYPATEVIVVDNASPGEDPALITDRFPGVKLIRSDRNLGFAGGNNLGIRQAKGEYILLLNNDTEVEPGFLEPLVGKLLSDPTIGAVSPQIRFYHKPHTVQYAGSAPINPFTIRSHGIGYREEDQGQFDCDALTAYVHGAAMLVPMRVVKHVGLMADCFFLYYEELDWGIRIRRAGYGLWFVHDSRVYHKESVSTGKLSPLRTYYLNRGRLLYLRRNISGFPFIIALFYQLFVAIPVNSIRFLAKGKRDHFGAYMRALTWHLQNMWAKEIHSNPVL